VTNKFEVSTAFWF